MHPILYQVAVIRTGECLGVSLGFTDWLQVPSLFKFPLADLRGSGQRSRICRLCDLCPGVIVTPQLDSQAHPSQPGQSDLH